MTFPQPLISAIVPVFNGSKFLLEAVESIRRQNYNPLEIIIVDDGSTDDTAKVAMSLGEDIRYVHQRNSGPASARNTGLRMARGEIIGFLDVDDLWPPNKLNIQLAHFTVDPMIEVVMGRTQYVKLPGAPDIDIQFEGPENTLAYINLGSGLFKRSVFDKVGTFDESMLYSEDHDWFLRARELNVSIKILKQITLYYRVHDQNMSIKENLDKQYKFMIKALKKSLDRRRKHNNGSVRMLANWFEFDEARKSTSK